MLQEIALSLICVGTGSAYTSDSAQTWINGQMITSTSSPYRISREDRAYLEVAGTSVRIRPPESIVPSVAGRGDDGWRDMTDLTITDREIRGRFSLNWINKPIVVVNRMTGELTIAGGDALAGRANFVGQCERAPDRPMF